MSRLISLFLAVSISTSIFAQDETILTIGDKTFSVEEFNYVYDKNNALTQDPLSKEEYIDLFVNYKLKVEEAISLGYDTMPSFKKELSYYRNELAKPYLSDKKAEDEVVKEAYEHMLYEINASHILVTLPKSPSPEDTIKAFNRILEAKQKLDNGADFVKIVKEYSEGPSAKQSNGNLGYFGAFMMVYPFEKAAYNTPVGEVSEITRTSFGYHLIKVHDKRENPGEILVAHIMKAFPYNSKIEIQNQSKIAIDEVYRKLSEGANFEALVKEYSDDKQTLSKNGQLPWFGTGRMVPEFSDAAFALTKNGQIAEPVKTKFGWHIIKRIDHRPVKPIGELRSEILQRIKRDERAFAGKKATVERLKKEYSLKVDDKAYAELKKMVVNLSTQPKDVLITKLEDANLKVGSFDDQVILSGYFANNALPHALPSKGINADGFDKMWNDFIEASVLKHEKDNLEKKYKEFRFLMNEYHDGLLIFEISQNKIWSKASNDSLGLTNYYNANTNDYVLDEHFEGRLFYCADKKVYKQVKKLLKSNPELVYDSLSNDLKTKVELKEGQFFKGDEPLLDKSLWKEKNINAETDYPFLLTNGFKKAESVQALNDIRGQVISDYQTALEKQWIEELKEKYKPKVMNVAF